MMSFFKKSVHSVLGLTIPMNLDIATPDQKPPSKCPGCGVLSGSSASGGLGLITAIGDPCRTPNVLESATVKTPSPSPFVKKDPGGIGFIDDVGGGVNGLMSCTESLGFESCDERRVDDDMDELCINNETRLSLEMKTKVAKRRKVGERKEVKKFPPPLSSFNHNGQPSFFLRPVRKDGRLELTGVRIDRPEILRAHREDGRLRLHLIRDDEEPHQVQDQEQEVEEEQEQEDEQDFKEEEEEGRDEEWKFRMTGEGFRRCNEPVKHHHDYHHHHHHHNLHVWSQHCVTTR